jgi:hypothetical protein
MLKQHQKPTPQCRHVALHSPDPNMLLKRESDERKEDRAEDWT